MNFEWIEKLKPAISYNGKKWNIRIYNKDADNYVINIIEVCCETLAEAIIEFSYKCDEEIKGIKHIKNFVGKYATSNSRDRNYKVLYADDYYALVTPRRDNRYDATPILLEHRHDNLKDWYEISEEEYLNKKVDNDE